MLFVDRALNRELEFVATESRLKLIFDSLTELAFRSSEDPKEQLTHLRAKRDQLNAEIARIERDGQVDSYGPAQARERLASTVGLIKELLGDFRVVEESFREITRGVQQHEAEGQLPRGGILEFALDAEDMLRTQDQGVSFFEVRSLPTLANRTRSPSQCDRSHREP